MSMKLLKNFDFEKDEDATYIKGFLRYLEKPTARHPVMTYIPDIDSKKVLDEVISAVRASLTMWGQELGYDLRERIGDTKVYFVKQKDLQEKTYTPALSKYKKAFSTGLFSDDTFAIYVSLESSSGEKRGYPELARTINHEFIHAASYKLIVFDKKDNSFLIHKNGFQCRNDYFMFNEALVDLINVYLIGKLWKLFGSIKVLVEPALSVIGYEGVILINALFHKLASLCQISYLQVFHIAQLDLLEGTNEILKLIQHHLGDAVLADIAQLKELRKVNTIDVNAIKEKALKYGLESLLNELVEYENTHNFMFLDNLRSLDSQ